MSNMFHVLGFSDPKHSLTDGEFLPLTDHPGQNFPSLPWDADTILPVHSFVLHLFVYLSEECALLAYHTLFGVSQSSKRGGGALHVLIEEINNKAMI